MKKVAAYTLMEVTIAMLLSAICITICYSAYGIINNYYSTFQKKNQTADSMLSLTHVLELDFLKSTYVIKNEEGFTVLSDSSAITYLFNENAVLRQLNEQHTDTFKLSVKELATGFEGNIIMEQDTIDQVRFKVNLARGVEVPIQINKFYSAANLFR